MNPKPIKNWTHEELMQSCAWLVIEGMANGEKLLSIMYSVDSLIRSWQNEKGLKP